MAINAKRMNSGSNPNRQPGQSEDARQQVQKDNGIVLNLRIKRVNQPIRANSPAGRSNRQSFRNNRNR